MNEQEFKNEFKQRLLNHLLDKYERSQAFVKGEATKQRPQTVLTGELFGADYEDEMDFRKRDWMHQVIDEMAVAGLVDVRHERSSDTIHKVYLEWEGVANAYMQLGRQPKKDKLSELTVVIGQLTSHLWDWVRRWAQQTVATLKEQRSAGLDINDVEGYVDAVRVLQELPSIQGDIPKRMLSLRVFGNSKHFEQCVERRLLSIVRQGLGEVSEVGEGELDLIGIVPHPKPVLLGGRGQFILNGSQLSWSLFPDGAALYPETLKTFEWFKLDVEHIVTIENLSSYHQWLRLRQPLRELVIYTGGFPHRILQSFLRSLWESLKNSGSSIPVYHWGDIDLGGIQIHHFLQRDCPFTIYPLFMDDSTLCQFGEPDLNHREHYQKKACALLQDDRYITWHSVLEVISQSGIKLEQEAIPDQFVKEALDLKRN
ncbi:Wadjet anti-phage system protein JetD domain-containing protein [Paenibacillus sp. YN15]|uniref:Wadjet anti-phage system protein JetD domain-containing protein n=1 Tax=Paenibacillus sp. YN15 TaxID=1742774 RepID=UPI000DCDFACB|nr:Wadjet anti-phage system protein JetD domain-containing protein [Paenibacillus sp. YN15]RAU92170.1 hypothetical protein DQG13_28045 [Paenibacillus sp. YN15]